MNAAEIIEKAQEGFARVNKMPISRVTGLRKAENGSSNTEGVWVISLEVLERKAIPDTMDVLGLYEVRLDNEGNLLSFERRKLRKRGETHEE